MIIEGLGWCIYHDDLVDDCKLKKKKNRCLDCQYFISKKEYATVEEATKILNKSDQTIRSWIKKGKLEAISHEFVDKYGSKIYRYKCYFIKRESLQKLLDENKITSSKQK